MANIYPWQASSWQQLRRGKSMGKIPHAVLLNGAEGIGKFDFAYNLAQSLLCLQQSHDHACNTCSACKLIQSGNHPDLLMIEPEAKAKNIKIDQIRELIAQLNNTAQQGGRIVVIIKYADLLNLAAANALLKTLEEPADNVVIILTTHNLCVLPATIRSRCYIITMITPEFSQGYAWLKRVSDINAADTELTTALRLAQHAPLKALSILQSNILKQRLQLFAYLYDLKNNVLIATVNDLDWNLTDLVTILISIVSDLIKIKSVIINYIADIDIINVDQIAGLQKIAHQIQIEGIFAYYQQLLSLKQDLLRNINLNQQLVIENLLLNWLRLF